MYWLDHLQRIAPPSTVKFTLYHREPLPLLCTATPPPQTSAVCVLVLSAGLARPDRLPCWPEQKIRHARLGWHGVYETAFQPGPEGIGRACPSLASALLGPKGGEGIKGGRLSLSLYRTHRGCVYILQHIQLYKFTQWWASKRWNYRIICSAMIFLDKRRGIV
jgi:hypothetical protein